jgi:hypothetical protein
VASSDIQHFIQQDAYRPFSHILDLDFRCANIRRKSGLPIEAGSCKGSPETFAPSREQEKSIPIDSTPCTGCGLAATRLAARGFNNVIKPARSGHSPLSSHHCIPGFELPLT